MLTIKNVSEVPMLYKVKTTQPANYQVRPNQGVIVSNQDAAVKIIFNFPLDSPQEEKAIKQDKFLVMLSPLNSTLTPAEVTANDLTQIWTEVPKENIEQYKLKVFHRRNNTLVQKALARIDEAPEEEIQRNQTVKVVTKS